MLNIQSSTAHDIKFVMDSCDGNISLNERFQDDDDGSDSFADYFGEKKFESELLQYVGSDDDDCDSSIFSECSAFHYSCSDGSCNDFDFFSGDISASEDDTEPSGMAFKCVRFGFVQVREYALTVGAHSAVNDTCPLQLDWEHGQDIYSDVSRFDSQPKTRLRRLSVQKRRQRIASVQGMSVKEVETLEYENLRDIKDMVDSNLLSGVIESVWRIAGSGWRGPADRSFTSVHHHNRKCSLNPKIRTFKAA
jgi:hypothetical protein